MIDTHCHLDQPAFRKDLSCVLARSRRAGVDQWIVPATRLADFPSVVALRSSALHVALGLHPLFLDDHPVDALKQLDTWLNTIQPVAVGEVGLDYLAPAHTHPAQRRLFEAQVCMAQRFQRPLLLHVRKAHDLVITLLQQCAFSQGGIVHAFNGSLQQAHRYGALGFRLGFGGVVTRDRARRIHKMATFVPDALLVLETDAPDLPPAGHLGERNEPAYLPLVAQSLAQLRQVSVRHVMEVTTHNAQACLGITHGTP